MKPLIRYAIVALVLLSLILIAGNRDAGAGVFPGGAARVLFGGSQAAVDPANDKPGTVKPPPGSVVITESGTYSVGGFCSFTVELLDPTVSVVVSLERPLPRPLPDDVHAVRQGCRVTYYRDGERIDTFSAEMGTARICFAATPKKTPRVYRYDVYSSSPGWSAAPDTSGQNGVVCSSARPSAVYVGTFQNP